MTAPTLSPDDVPASHWEDTIAASQLALRPLTVNVDLTRHGDVTLTRVSAIDADRVLTNQHKLTEVTEPHAGYIAVNRALNVLRGRPIAWRRLQISSRVANIVQQDAPDRSVPHPLARQVRSRLAGTNVETVVDDDLPALIGAERWPPVGAGVWEALRRYADELNLTVVYADASKLAGKGASTGWCWWTPERHVAQGDVAPARIDELELTAVQHAAQHAAPGRDLLIATDCTAAFVPYDGPFVAAGRTVHVVWGPAHSDEHGHNHADRLARFVARRARERRGPYPTARADRALPDQPTQEPHAAEG